MPGFDHLVEMLLNRLMWTSLQAVALIGVIVLIVRLAPRLPASAHCALWWLVGLQVVIGIGWQAPVRLPWLAPVSVVTATQIGSQPQSSAELPSVVAQGTSSARSDWWSPLNWRDALVALWLLGMLVQLRGVVQDSRRMRHWLRDAHAPADSLRRQCDELARRIGLRRCPQLRISAAIGSPLVAGFFRPVIVWPAGQILTAEETSLALAHELAHVRRGDLWLGCLPAVAQRLLFFHPLLRWALREYALHREAACDARAIHIHGADAGGYGRLLLRLGVADVGPATLASASSTSRGLKRRLLMLQSAGMRAPRMSGWTLVACVAVIGLVPYRLVAANRPTWVPPKAEIGHARTPAMLQPKCVSPVAADDVPFCGAKFLAYANPRDMQGSAVLFDRGVVVIYGYHADVVAAKRFYQPDANLLWFRRDGKAYVVRDPAILGHAAATIAQVTDRNQKGIEVSYGLDMLTLRLGELNRNLARLDKRLDGPRDQQALLDQQGPRADPKTVAAIAARIASTEAVIGTEQAKIDALHGSVDARQMDLQRWQRESWDPLANFAGTLAKLADAALAKGAAHEVAR